MPTSAGPGLETCSSPGRAAKSSATSGTPPCSRRAGPPPSSATSSAGKKKRPISSPFYKRVGSSPAPARLAILLPARRIDENVFVPGAEAAVGGGRKPLVVFSGLEGMLHPLHKHREMIQHRL